MGWAIRRLRRNQRGAAAIEYGLIALLISAAAAAAMTTIGSDLSHIFNSVAGKL